MIASSSSLIFAGFNPIGYTPVPAGTDADQGAAIADFVQCGEGIGEYARVTCYGIRDAGGELNGRGVYRTQCKRGETVLHRELHVRNPDAVESQRFGLLNDFDVVQK